MNNYRSLVRWLYREYSDYPLQIRRVGLGGDYGKCDLVGKQFQIQIERDLCEGGAVLCTLHEMAHVLSWHKDKSPSQHGPEFGRAYHEVWETYQDKFLGRARLAKGIRSGRAAGAKKAKRNSLREAALAKAGQFGIKFKTQMDRLAEADPEKAAELKQLIDDWRSGDAELRQAYPTVSAISRFVLSLDLPVTFSETTTRRLFNEGHQ